MHVSGWGAYVSPFVLLQWHNDAKEDFVCMTTNGERSYHLLCKRNGVTAQRRFPYACLWMGSIAVPSYACLTA